MPLGVAKREEREDLFVSFFVCLFLFILFDYSSVLLGFLSATTLNGILTTQCMLFKEKPTPTRRRVTSGKSGKKN